MNYTLIEYMPIHLRAAHEAAGNSGVYPANGAERAYVEGLAGPNDLHPKWARAIKSGIHPDKIPAGAIKLVEVPPDALPPYMGEEDTVFEACVPPWLCSDCEFMQEGDE